MHVLIDEIIGQYGEYYAKMEFTSYGFDVYTSEVDEHGIDFIAKSKEGVFYEVQVKSVRNDNYVFIRKSKMILDERHLVCFIRFIDGELPDCYVFPATVWQNPDGSLFTSKDYEGLKSAPEYGISVKKKKNLETMRKYKVENILGNKYLCAGISFFAVIWCVDVMFLIGFALLPCIIIFIILGKVMLSFLRGFFSRF